MVRRRVAQTREQVKEKLVAALIEDHSPREVAVSFSVGVFLTALPTLGTGFLAFLVLAYLFKQLSKVALFASVLILNPPVKWGVYATSFWLGNQILGPVPGLSFDGVSVSMGSDVLVRLWTGNVVLAVVFAAVGYVLAFRLISEYRRRQGWTAEIS
ncbi:hypothetical protein BVU17_01370 [Haloarcula taiwanensis]|uniref:DUF2062 domain-containing protein n=1 Tax=Haloarcula taiwanensis TaxID=1932004 RepID=A0A2H4ZUT9_9EURY|nr:MULTISPECIES: DUF2062 domain-containing protein [Haloarcula]AUG46230.1 hypothetical protein BVU17_01370 [Haloarcula taiwanensis]RLM36451.1 DUF2062 domain-containing protein [Haloarcula sp. Atlit-120R]RLM45166.1 DUF2062 domain-containing protein [Haloarcula sp. Atlit-47R]RLM88690.1 DUF2062 domain-containing protein [Haloarcula sp. Atlit-7R]